MVGGGGREHALGWKLSQSDDVETVFYVPGNAGTSEGKCRNELPSRSKLRGINKLE